MKSRRDNLVFIRYRARGYVRIANNTLILHNVIYTLCYYYYYY